MKEMIRRIRALWEFNRAGFWWRKIRHPGPCACTYRDLKMWGPHVGHPTLSCPLATDCGGWTFDPPCGGCDRCLRDQVAYYEAQRKGLI